MRRGAANRYSSNSSKTSKGMVWMPPKLVLDTVSRGRLLVMLEVNHSWLRFKQEITTQRCLHSTTKWSQTNSFQTTARFKVTKSSKKEGTIGVPPRLFMMLRRETSRPLDWQRECLQSTRKHSCQTLRISWWISRLGSMPFWRIARGTSMRLKIWPRHLSPSTWHIWMQLLACPRGKNTPRFQWTPSRSRTYSAHRMIWVSSKITTHL